MAIAPLIESTVVLVTSTGCRYYDGVVASVSVRPYAASLKNHTELTFSAYWSDKSDPLPSVVIPGPRPSIKGWPNPKRYLYYYKYI